MKRITALLMALAIITAMAPMAGAYVEGQKVYDPVDYWDGSVDTSWFNSYNTEFKLYTGAQLAGLAYLIQSGRTTLKGKTIHLMADIVLNTELLQENGEVNSGAAKQWTPIGCYSGGWQPFSGTFNGDGHIISGIYINKSTEFVSDKNVGFFGYTNEATIKNVTILDSYIYGYDFCGGIVGNSYNSTLQNCIFNGTVAGPLRVGGIAGSMMDSRLYNCLSSGYAKADRYLGGIAGYMNAGSSIESCISLTYLKINTGAAEKFGSTPNGGAVGVADAGAGATQCSYLAGTAESAIGNGEIQAEILKWTSFKNGEVAQTMSEKATELGDDTLKWEMEDGFVKLSQQTESHPNIILPPYELRTGDDYVFTKNFSDTIGSYNGFSDVVETEWYGTQGDGSLALAVNLGIMNGYTDGTFAPTKSLKISEAIKMAVNVYDIYNNGKATEFVMGPVWYENIVAYAIENGIIKEKDFSDYEATATRAEMAYIFANALPESELLAINEITSLPDVNENTKYSNSIFKLYNAGILTGNDAYGRFDPDSAINRAQAAAIISRLAVKSQRKTLKFS